MASGKQLNLIDQFFHTNKSTTRSAQFLKQIDELVNWNSLAKLVSVLDRTNTGKGGRPRHDAIMMIKALFIQHFYGLSDPALEDQLNDRLSFQHFVGLSLADKSPDMRSFWKFKDELVEHELLDKLFEGLNAQLEEKQLFIGKGIIADATLIASENRPVSKEKKESEAFQENRQYDKDATSTVKNNTYTYGYKGHVGMDMGSKLIRTRVYSPASDHDSLYTQQLAGDHGEALFADKAYANDDYKRMAREHNWYYCILDKAKRGQTLSSKQVKRNKKFSKIRCKVEHCFAWMKTQCGKMSASAKSLKKNALKFDFMCMGWNMRQASILLKKKHAMG